MTVRMTVMMITIMVVIFMMVSYKEWCHVISKYVFPVLFSSPCIADYPALSVNRAGGGNPLYAEDTPNQEFLIWCAPIQEFLIRCTPIQEFEFTDSVLVFVRGVIWHQEGYYCYIISQMNTFIINKILPRKCLPLLTACRHLWQLHLVVLKFIQRNDTSRWRSFYCVRKL